MMSDRKVYVLHNDGSKQLLEGLHEVKKGQRVELHPGGPDDEHLTEVTTFTAATDGYWTNKVGYNSELCGEVSASSASIQKERKKRRMIDSKLAGLYLEDGSHTDPECLGPAECGEIIAEQGLQEHEHAKGITEKQPHKWLQAFCTAYFKAENVEYRCTIGLAATTR